MKIFLFLSIFILNAQAQKQPDPVVTYDSFVNSEKLNLTKTDHIIAERLISIIKMTEKGYVSQDVLSKAISELETTKHFAPFSPWLKSIQAVSKIKDTHELLVFCNGYINPKEIFSLEKVLEKTAGNYCRERSLEAISRDIDSKKNITDEASQFIQENLKFFLTKKNKKNFAFFIQSLVSKPDVLKKISQDVTTYSVRNEIVPSPEVLKDILINEQITKLIQDKGFNPLQHQNVFYAEYGKLIEMGYKSLDKQPEEKKVKEHYSFLKNYLELNQDHLPVGLCLTRMNDFSKAVHRAGFKELARDIFKFIIKKNNKEIYEDAIFFYLWTYLSNNEFEETLKKASELKLMGKDSQILDPRLKFWLGYANEASKKTKEAILLYENIIDRNPLSYYAIMAVKKLQVLKPDSPVVNFYPNNVVKAVDSISIQIKDLNDDYISSLIRLKAWAKIDSQRMMKIELRRLNRHSRPKLLGSIPSDRQQLVKSDLHVLNAKLIQGSNNHLATFRYLYEVMDKKEVNFNRALLEILYPKPFLEDLTRILKNDKVDPLIVLSLIRQESVFNPHARSPVGARGLMQLMPTTAKRMRRSVRDKHLVNPAINLELGTKYFKNLLKRYDGNLVYVLSAYNAGESRVERWKNLYFDADDTILKNIEAIPFLETRNYVKLIFRNIFFYKLLLEQQKLAADSSQANKIFDVNLGFKK